MTGIPVQEEARRIARKGVTEAWYRAPLAGAPGFRSGLKPACLPTGRRARRRCRRTHRAVVMLLPVGVLLGAAGCSFRPAAFEIVDYPASGQPKRYHATFDEAYYDVDVHGNVNVALRRTEAPSNAVGHPFMQVLHLRSFWRPQPGATVAHRTQVNATATYCLMSGRRGTAMEGAGSVFFRENRRKTKLIGSLDLAILRPVPRLASDHAVFSRVEMNGSFRARRDPRRVARIVNEMQRLFLSPVAPSATPVSVHPTPPR